MIREEILERERSGRSLDLASAESDDARLVAAAYARMGGWYEALEACGIDARAWRRSNTVGRKKTTAERRRIEERLAGTGLSGRDLDLAARVVQRISSRATTGRSVRAVDVAREDQALFMAANRCCGSWDRALGFAGVKG